MATEWDTHTTLTAAGGDTFTAELDPGWVVGGGVNGGYLLGPIGTARPTVPGKPDPISVSAYYLSACVPGPARCITRVCATGGSVATLAADLSQDGVDRITVLATYGDLRGCPMTWGRPPARRSSRRWTSASPTRRRPTTSSGCAPAGALRHAVRPAPCRVDSGQPSGNGELQAWFRLADGREPDPISLLTVVDALPPVTFELGRRAGRRPWS